MLKYFFRKSADHKQRVDKEQKIPSTCKKNNWNQKSCLKRWPREVHKICWLSGLRIRQQCQFLTFAFFFVANNFWELNKNNGECHPCRNITLPKNIFKRSVRQFATNLTVLIMTIMGGKNGNSKKWSGTSEKVLWNVIYVLIIKYNITMIVIASPPKTW